MKKISVVLIAALVVSLLFGCGKSDDAKGTGKTTLSVWYWGEQEVPGYKAYMEEMVKRYEKKNPDIKVIICIRHFVRQRRQGKVRIFNICGAELRQWKMFGKET